MRKFKFRLYDTVAKKMVNYINCSIDINGEGVQSFDENGVIEGTEHNKYLIPLEYTGQKDKNNVEIYENDILQDSRKRRFKVTWNNDIGSYVNKPLDEKETSYPCFNIGTVKGLEVIGNIYESSELLEN